MGETAGGKVGGKDLLNYRRHERERVGGEKLSSLQVLCVAVNTGTTVSLSQR